MFLMGLSKNNCIGTAKTYEVIIMFIHFVKSLEMSIITVLFYGAPNEVTQHPRDTRIQEFVCVEVLWPSQPNGVMSSVVSFT